MMDNEVPRLNLPTHAHGPCTIGSSVLVRAEAATFSRG
jgi:hypothetical protein